MVEQHSGFNALGPVSFRDRIGFDGDDLTPSVVGGNVFVTATDHGAARNITDFNGGVTGQVIYIISSNPANATTIVDGGNLRLTANWVDGADKTLVLVSLGGTDWVELSRT